MKKSAVGRDFLQAKNSFNYPRDNYIIQGSGSYYQLSEKEFIKARKQDDGAPTEIKDPNNDYQWAKWKPETTYDKMAKAHFKEMDRRKYEEERNKNINLRGTKIQIPLAPPLPALDNPLTQQLRNVKLKSFNVLEAPPQLNPLLADIKSSKGKLKDSQKSAEQIAELEPKEQEEEIYKFISPSAREVSSRNRSNSSPVANRTRSQTQQKKK
jgi:hypothetical protein